MKNKFIKIGLPIICATPVAIGGGIAIDSYIQDSVGYLTDLEGWEPTIPQYQPSEGEIFNNNMAKEAYGEAVKANPQIYVEDWYYDVTSQAIKEFNDLERTYGRGNVTYDFKMRARNINIDSMEYTSMSGTHTYYLLSGDLDVRANFKFENDITQKSGYETVYVRRRMTNCEFSCARDGVSPGQWHVGVHTGFDGSDIPWQFKSSYDYKWVYHVESKTGESSPVHEEKNESHIYADNYTVAGRQIPYFETRYFENAPYALTVGIAMSSESPDPEDYGMPWPEVTNEAAPVGQQFTTQIKYVDDPARLTGMTIPWIDFKNGRLTGEGYTWTPGTQPGIEKVGTLTITDTEYIKFPNEIKIVFQYDNPSK